MKYRVHEIARMTGLESEVIIDHLRDVGEFVRSSASGVEDVVALRVLEFFGATDSEPKGEALPTPKPISFTPPTMYTWEANPVPEPRNQEVLDRITALEKRFPAAAEHRRMLKGLGSQFVFAKTFRASDGKTLGLALARFSGAIGRVRNHARSDVLLHAVSGPANTVIYVGKRRAGIAFKGRNAGLGSVPLSR